MGEEEGETQTLQSNRQVRKHKSDKIKSYN